MVAAQARVVERKAKLSDVRSTSLVPTLPTADLPLYQQDDVDSYESLEFSALGRGEEDKGN